MKSIVRAPSLEHLFLMASMVLCGGCGESKRYDPGTTPLRGRVRIPVGDSPSDLLLLDDRKTLACKDIGEHSLSLIDLVSRKEVARVRLPVLERNVSEQEGVALPSEAYLTGMAEDPRRRALWVASNEGQLFELNRDTNQVTTRYTCEAIGDEVSEFLALSWDAERKRLLIGASKLDSEEGVLLSFTSDAPKCVARIDMPILAHAEAKRHAVLRNE